MNSSRRKFIYGIASLWTLLSIDKAFAFVHRNTKRDIMFNIRRSNERGLANHGWLNSKHTFSFASYFDPKHMGFKNLRVINEDKIQAGTGFGAHPHRDMEIISYVVKGGLTHKDSIGTTATISPGEVQRMSAGTGITHSEFNAFEDQETHFFQIWITPNKLGVKPGYGQKSFEEEINSKDKVLVISEDGREGSILIHQDADIYISRMTSGKKIQQECRRGRGIWIQVVKGKIQIGEHHLKSGDAISTESEGNFDISSLTNSELIIFDLV